jgi:ABC-type glycerol-3-phosphate transport system substrate-binding protein
MLAACASGAPGQGSYGLDPGVATYDALKAATDKCHADGGQLVLKTSYDQHELSNYECKIGGAK